MFASDSNGNMKKHIFGYSNYYVLVFVFHIPIILFFQEFVLFPLLSSAAAFASPSHVMVKEGWKEPISLWTLLPAERGSKKSALFRTFTGQFKMIICLSDLLFIIELRTFKQL